MPESNPTTPCVLTIILDGLGKVLFIKRHDTKQYSVCAGHIEGNETPEEAARREIKEETGLTPEYLTRLEYKCNPNLTCFSAQCQGAPTNQNDPDSEGSPKWVSIIQGVPKNIWNHLSGPKDDTNIIKQLFTQALGLQKSEYNWLWDVGFMDLRKAEASPIVEQPKRPKAPKKLSIAHQPKEATEKNLLVVHNLSQDKLQHVHELGGLAAPSIAIHHKNHPFSSFGDISLVAHPSLVDPEKGVPVFNADAYTARHPRANYKVNKPKLTSLIKELYPHAKTVGEENHLSYQLEDDITNKGAREAVESRSMEPTLKAAYLHEKGHSVKPLTKPADVTEEIVKQKPLQDFFAQHGYSGNGDPNYEQGLAEAFKQSHPLYMASLKEGVSPETQQDMEDTFGDTSAAFDEDGTLNWGLRSRLVKSHQNLGKTEHDRWGTQEAVDKKLKDLGLEDDYSKWAINKVKPTQSTPYIPMGARKVPYTMENILRHVTKGGVKGTEKSGEMYGTGYSRSKGAMRYQNLEHIKGDQGSLVPHDEFEKWKEASNKKFGDIADKVSRYHSVGGFHTMDALANAVGESFKPGHNLSSELVKDGFKGVPDRIVQELKQWGNELRYGPSTYFEAKPQRAVGLNEFGGAAVPHDVSPDTLDILKQHGIDNIERYKRGDEQDRLRAVNHIADLNNLRLSEKDLGLEELVKAEIPTLVARYQWNRNTPQSFGNQMEIHRINKPLYEKYVRRLVRGAPTFEDHQKLYPGLSHISLVRLHGEKDLKVFSVGSEKEMRPGSSVSQWAKRVNDFNSPEAVEWGSKIG